MSRGYTFFTESKIEERIIKGYGQGEGKNYKPWLQVGDFHSSGRSHRIKGIKTGRIHHFFSDLEAQYFYILEWDNSVLDIREQYPLFPVSETENLALALQIKHPIDIKVGISNVMTTDFLITSIVHDVKVIHARSVKYEKDLSDKRTIQKQAIEELFWAEHNIEWKLVTEKSISAKKSANIKRLLKHYEDPLNNVLDSNERLKLQHDLLRKILEFSSLSIKTVTTGIDYQYRLDGGTTLSYFYFLAAHKLIPVNIASNLLATDRIDKVVNVAELSTSFILGGSQCESYG